MPWLVLLPNKQFTTYFFHTPGQVFYTLRHIFITLWRPSFHLASFLWYFQIAMFSFSCYHIARRVKITAVSIALCCSTPTPAQVTTFNFKRLGANEGLSDGIVHAFVQDKYGYIWVGTTYGLNRFDGVNIKTFFSKLGDSTSLLDNYVRSLYCDKNNNLWVGTKQGFVVMIMQQISLYAMLPRHLQ